MNSRERRQYFRRPTDVGVSIFNKDEMVQATVVDLCEGGIGLHCQRAFFPGNEIYLKRDSNYNRRKRVIFDTHMR